MRTLINIDREISFIINKIPHELYADDACVCYPWYISQMPLHGEFQQRYGCVYIVLKKKINGLKLGVKQDKNVINLDEK